MGYSSNVYKSASDLLFQRRLKAEKSADRRREEIYAKLPRVKQLERQLASCEIQLARAVLSGENVTQKVTALRDENLSIQRELKSVLASNGYPEDVFEPRYTCKKCGDTGYFEEKGKTLVCSCLKNALIACACEELNRFAPLSLSTFDSFNLNYYDKAPDEATGISPYNHMSSVFRFCKSYADNFSKTSGSILMKGATGLGKTHLSLAIANEAIKKGYGVIYVSAPALVMRLEKNYFANQDDDSTLDMLLECDLLIIDDLGTEFHGQFSTSQFYNIFNSRMLSGKPVIINTNHTLRELENIYTDRFVSRICGCAQKLDFLGRDIRIRKSSK